MTDTAKVNRIRLMTPALSLHDSITAGITWIVPLLVLLASGYLVNRFATLPDLPDTAGGKGGLPAAWPGPSQLPADGWGIFQSGAGEISGAAGELSRRFRLAGTFFAFDALGTDSRKAILDDTVTKQQIVVSEHERIEDIEVQAVFAERVILRRGGTEEQLWLSFSTLSGKAGGPGSKPGDGSGHGPGQGTEAGLTSAGEGKFGRRQVGKNSYVYNRDALIKYYGELRDEPERLVKLFDSMKPLYGKDGKIQGYNLDMVGEEEFFGEMGLKQGDVVRKVNSVPMTNRRSAEWFIGEFVENRANVFVFEVDRAGQAERLVYQVR